MKSKLPEKGSAVAVVCRACLIATMLFVAYKMAMACGGSESLQQYLASLQPGLVVAVSMCNSSSGSSPAGILGKERSGKTPGYQQTSCPESSGAIAGLSGATARPISATARPIGATAGPKKIITDTWPLLYPTFPNESVSLLRQVAENRTKPCYQKRTTTAKVFGLPKSVDGNPIRLHTGMIHELRIVSYAKRGRKRCAGGDFFETDLSGVNWKTRPPIVDNQNGSYKVQLMVDSRFAGLFVFKIVLLFANFHALERKISGWSRLEDILTVEIEFVAPSHQQEFLPDLRRCTDRDFGLKAWSGRWTRHTWNQTCEIRDDGRFICIDPGEECQDPWCEGKVGILDSNGWVYSAHCKFKIFTQDEAWDCLNGRWLFFWGDSNHDDSVRNLLNLVLGFPFEDVNHMRRWFNGTFEHPEKKNYSVTITKIFNGHAEELGNLAGLSSLRSKQYRDMLVSFFNETRSPDTMVLNSGLHDAHFYRETRDFAENGVDYAIRFWKELWSHAAPAVVYRTTIASADSSRRGLTNPHKMDIYNRIFVEKLQQLELIPSLKVVDAFDLTFPWHYDLNHTDGVHYGRPPSKTPWPWRPPKDAWRAPQVGHQYFVDLMLVHILLNAICPLKT